jgi:hypothetical protein
MTKERKGCRTVILNLLGIKERSRPEEPQEENLPYRLRDDFLSPSEASFYRVLKQAVADQFLVFPKIGLQELFFVSGQEGNRTYRNKIDRKHVDFVLCDPATLKPVVAVELDDASHKRADRIERDRFVDKVFATANLPLVRIPAQATYSTKQLSESLNPFLPRMTPQQAAVPQPSKSLPETAEDGEAANQAPVCSKCGVPLVLRTVRNGRHAGKQFYGCVNYPQCREMAPIVAT